MSKLEKLLIKMRNNAKDWRIEDIKMLADHYEISYRQPGTSHVTFRFKNGKKITVPAYKPIKAIYIKQFIHLFDEDKEV